MPRPTAAHYRRQALRRERWHDAFATAILLVVAVLVFWLVPAPDAAHARQRAAGPGAPSAPGDRPQAGVPPCLTLT